MKLLSPEPKQKADYTENEERERERLKKETGMTEIKVIIRGNFLLDLIISPIKCKNGIY